MKLAQCHKEVKTKTVLGILASYGAIVTIAYHVHNEQVYESSLFLFNFIVEMYIIPPILLYFANEVGNPIIGNNLLVLRILISMTFWGGIPSGVFLLIKKNRK